MLSATQHPVGQLRRPGRILTVCVVDPQADDYRGWEALAEAKGAKIQIVASAEEALRMARTAAVELWVINSELPALSGYELCQMLKGRQPHAAVYLVANEYTPDSERAAWAARATLFCCKPAHLESIDLWLQQRQSVVLSS